ncbi:outer membrane protein [Salinarimonas ramus]|uniref:Outer surface protein n=1 Tax=Salinarimonas ramus TaxID=690164 RepID=A0A917Q7J4_9HYPH|nr:outer membrane beta-barrel protein [Salinarimonas ramus]GGK34288.1 outer surface protein [Salinarimonas ramus]
MSRLIHSRPILPLAAAALAAMALLPGTASAADVLPPLPALDGPAPASAPVGSGWYLRGDIGYTAYRDPETRARVGGVSAPLDGAELDPAPSIGLGAGYKFNSWLRADVTADHRFANTATVFSGVPNAAAFAQGDLSASTVLANVYLDLGTWHGFTPYVGGGVGYAWTRLDDFSVTNCVAPCAIGGIGLGTRLRDDEEIGGDFAWALMAGVAVDLGRSLSLDIGYRYVDLGTPEFETAAGTTFEVDDLTAHEARIGVRWTFAAPEPSIVPISRSY